MKIFVRVMKALSDPNRVKIIKMLQASLLSNLKHFLEEDPDICKLNETLPGIDRHDIVGK